ncbi:uncharacterized protein [Triticum aestivum]|uniref:uncharacterized protein isoform X2 n=1 Tax=Triticum aestivum TaxID=4565 RepID=UPI001D026CF7|nr:uncharacterized protein LOC123046131 isoform X2 [Triticum aestivum]
MAPVLPAPAAAAAAAPPPFCRVSLPARSAFPSSFPVRSLGRFAARSSGGGGRPEPKAGDEESKAVLDAFFLGKALAEALTERAESVVGEVFSVVGQWQAEQQKQVQEFQVFKGRAEELQTNTDYVWTFLPIKCTMFPLMD